MDILNHPFKIQRRRIRLILPPYIKLQQDTTELNAQYHKYYYDSERDRNGTGRENETES